MLLPLLGLTNVARADAPADVPEQYRSFFRHYVDNRSFTEKALNTIGFSKEDVGRSLALLAGVSRYAKMKGTAANLAPARADIEKLAAYLVQREFFDEVVVLLDDAVSDANLSFFLERYFPQRLSEVPKSRFLFAYSGHGTTRPDGRGYLLTTDALDLDDIRNSINLRKIRAMLDEVVYNGHFVLVLVNACYAADLHGRRGFGEGRYWPKLEGAHVITAGGTGEPTWHDPSLGAGSIFFETLLAGLDGRADYNGEGIISFKELDAYLTDKIKQIAYPFSSGRSTCGRRRAGG
jgi:lysozyme